MQSYCLKCKKNAENINARTSKTNNGKTMILSKCAICSNKKSKYIKEQEPKGLLSNLGIRAPLSKIPICNFSEYKMNDIINKFLLAGDMFMAEMHLRQPQFTCGGCVPFTKNKETIQKFKETGDSRCI